MDKAKAALAALDNHTRRYGVAVPDRLRAFYAGGDFARYHLMHATADVEGWSGSTFQLALTPPTWLNKDDDAINGPRGEWEDAKRYVPLFVTDQALYAVAQLDAPGCPVGWYHEENFADGVSPGATSLDAFLSSLRKQPVDKDDVVTPADPDQVWDEDFTDDGSRAFDAAHDD